jgi:hypothetical protein
VNRSVPCKHKGIREFSRAFGDNRVKAVSFKGSEVQILSARPYHVSRHRSYMSRDMVHNSLSFGRAFCGFWGW